MAVAFNDGSVGGAAKACVGPLNQSLCVFSASQVKMMYDNHAKMCYHKVRTVLRIVISERQYVFV